MSCMYIYMVFIDILYCILYIIYMCVICMDVTCYVYIYMYVYICIIL